MPKVTEAENEFFQYRHRYEKLCGRGYLDWTHEGRNIMRILLLFPDGLSQRQIAHETGIARQTVKRRVLRMEELSVSRMIEGRVSLTRLGRMYFVTMHRELDKLARGQQVGVSASMMRLLRMINFYSADQLDRLGVVSFPPLDTSKT